MGREALLGKHAKWIAAAGGRGVPLPDPMPAILLGPGPAYRNLDYYDPWGNVVYLLYSSAGSRWTLGHELGHAFAYRYLTTRELRNRASAILGHPGLRWYWRNWNPLTHWKQPNEENFADAYAKLFCGHDSPRLRRLRRFLIDVKEAGT